MKLKTVTKDEAMKYILPILKEIMKRNLPYEIKESEVVFKIPKLLPIEE